MNILGLLWNLVDNNVFFISRHTYWQVNYILMKDNTTIESMTSLPVNLTSLQNSLTSAGYDIMVVKDTKMTMRLALAFSFFLNQDVNVNLKTDAGNQTIKKFTSAIEVSWRDKFAGMYRKNPKNPDTWTFVCIQKMQTEWQIV